MLTGEGRIMSFNETPWRMRFGAVDQRIWMGAEERGNMGGRDRNGWQKTGARGGTELEDTFKESEVQEVRKLMSFWMRGK